MLFKCYKRVALNRHGVAVGAGESIVRIASAGRES